MIKDLREGEELQNMARTAGWSILEQHIQHQVAAKLKELERTDFTDLAQVARLQGEIKGLRAPLIFLQDRQRRYAGALQKGD